MEAALEVFAEKGFETASISLIAEACGISKGGSIIISKAKKSL